MQATKKRGGIPLPHLAAWRERQFISQLELSRLAGVSRSSIVAAEHGAPIRLFTADKLAKALRISPAQLLRAPAQEQEGALAGAGASNG